MIRNIYNLNHRVQGRHLFPGVESVPEDHLLGFRHLPKFWSIKWDLFLNIKNSPEHIQKSRQIDTQLSEDLGILPSRLEREAHHNLASIDLLKGYKMDLPSGQTVAATMSVPKEDILVPDSPEMPLWYYILKEAEEKQKKIKEGTGDEQGTAEVQDRKGKLGPVGGRIVAEVIIGLLAGDPYSYLNVNPEWQPCFCTQGDKFELRDILHYAKAPLTRECLEKKFKSLEV